MKILLFCTIGLVILACNANETVVDSNDNDTDTVKIETAADKSFHFETYQTDGSGWSYQLYKNDSVKIDALHSPKDSLKPIYTSRFKAAKAAQAILNDIKLNASTSH